MSGNMGSIRETVVELYETYKKTINKEYLKRLNKIESQMQKRIAEILNVENADKVNVCALLSRLTIEISFSTLITKEFICNIVSEIIPYTEQLNKLYADYKGDLERLDKWYSETLRALIEGKKFPSFPELMLEERW